jgi:hypothetical protein
MKKSRKERKIKRYTDKMEMAEIRSRFACEEAKRAVDLMLFGDLVYDRYTDRMRKKDFARVSSLLIKLLKEDQKAEHYKNRIIELIKREK